MNELRASWNNVDGNGETAALLEIDNLWRSVKKVEETIGFLSRGLSDAQSVREELNQFKEIIDNQETSTKEKVEDVVEALKAENEALKKKHSNFKTKMTFWFLCTCHVNAKRDAVLNDRTTNIEKRAARLHERETRMLDKELAMQAQKDRLSALQTKLDNREHKLEEKELLLDQRETDIGDKYILLSEREDAIDDRESALKSKERKAEELETILMSRQSKLSREEKDLLDRIEQLNTNVSRAKRKEEVLVKEEEELSSKRHAISNKEKEVEQRSSLLDAREQKLNEEDRRLTIELQCVDRIAESMNGHQHGPQQTNVESQSESNGTSKHEKKFDGDVKALASKCNNLEVQYNELKEQFDNLLFMLRSDKRIPSDNSKPRRFRGPTELSQMRADINKKKPPKQPKK